MTTTWRSSSLVGTVGVRLITVVPAVIVSVTRPVLGNTAAAVAFELDAGAGMAAPCFVTVISAVIVVVTAPVNVNASTICTSELRQWEAGWVGTRVRLIRAVSTVVIQVTCPGDGNTATTGTWILIGWASASRAGSVRLIFIIATVIVSITKPTEGDTAVVLAFKPVSWASVLVAKLRRLVTVVQTIVVPVTPPTLLDTAVVLAGKLTGLALRRGHIRGVGFAGDVIHIQDLIVRTGTGPAIRDRKAQAAAVAVVNSAEVGSLLLLGIIDSDLKNGRPLIS